LEFKKNSEFNRGLGRVYCFSVTSARDEARDGPGMAHRNGKTVIPPQSPIEFTVLFELQFTLHLRENLEKYIAIVSVTSFYKERA
jgi:hypothetical protein